MKNLKGFIPGKQKHLAHLVGLDSAIVDLNKLIKADLIVVDGIVGMEGMMGPTWGSPVEVGLIIAGDNVVATDAVCCKLMGINPKEVKHLTLASKFGLGPIDLNKIELFGEPIDRVSRKFVCPKHSAFYSQIGNEVLHGVHLIRNPIARLMKRQTVTKHIPEKKIRVDSNKCNLCKLCQKACPKGAIKVTDRVLIDKGKCILCCCCIEACNQGAIYLEGK
jgi:ferredoxin